jgi:N-acetylmuramoyl-L-alanine amidase
MFELMQDHDMKESVNFAKLVQGEMVHTGGRNDMGVLQANLAVLRLTYMPSVLLEVGYISTPAEEQFLMSTSGRQAMAKSIYNAIVRYKALQTGRESKLEKPTPETKEKKTDKQDKETPAGTAPAEAEAPAATHIPATDNTKSSASANTGKQTVYKVQVLAGSTKLRPNDRQFKGLTCEMHQQNGRYTYTYGSATTLEEAKRLRQSIIDKFPQAFIVTFEK